MTVRISNWTNMINIKTRLLAAGVKKEKPVFLVMVLETKV